MRDKNALLSPEEAQVVDDWLVDDLGDGATGGRGVKRRRVHQFEDELTRRSSLSSHSSAPRRSSFRPLSPINIANNSDSNDSEPNRVS